jgi:hypothetical protein
VTAIAQPESVAALEELATALDPREFAMILVTGPEQRPCLTVAHRFTCAAEDIYTDRSAYWWPWVQPIAAISDPLAAAHHIMALLRADPGARS